jgi:hypothetical protein
MEKAAYLAMRKKLHTASALALVEGVGAALGLLESQDGC